MTKDQIYRIALEHLENCGEREFNDNVSELDGLDLVKLTSTAMKTRSWRSTGLLEYSINKDLSTKHVFELAKEIAVRLSFDAEFLNLDEDKYIKELLTTVNEHELKEWVLENCLQVPTPIEKVGNPDYGTFIRHVTAIGATLLSEGNFEEPLSRNEFAQKTDEEKLAYLAGWYNAGKECLYWIDELN